jgi:hypothetical protein
MNQVFIFIYFILALTLGLGITLCYSLAPTLGIMLTWFSIVGLLFNFVLDVARR